MFSTKVVVSFTRDVQFQNALNRSSSFVDDKRTMVKMRTQFQELWVRSRPMERIWSPMGHPWGAYGNLWEAHGAHAAPMRRPWEPMGDPWGPTEVREGGKGTLYQQTPDQPHQRPLHSHVPCCKWACSTYYSFHSYGGRFNDPRPCNTRQHSQQHRPTFPCCPILFKAN